MDRCKRRGLIAGPEYISGVAFRWKAALSDAVAIAIHVFSALPGAIACECRPKPPICQAYGQSPMIFLGTVTEALATEDNRVVRARMRIDRAYKGVSEPELILFDDGMCDGPELQIGEQYLMYTRRLDEGDVPSRGCTRSRHVKFAEEDLKYLKGLNEAAPTARVFGQVASWPKGAREKRLLPGAVVTLQGQ